MKLLLTSGGLYNQSMVKALAELVGKPFEQTKVVFIPTAANAEKGNKWWLVDDYVRFQMLNLQEFDIVDIAAMPKTWKDRIKDADVIVVGGGNNFYLSYWLEKSGFFDELEELLKTKVYVGISAGSMIVADSNKISSEVLGKYGTDFVDHEYEEFGPVGESLDKSAKLVPFAVRPHLNSTFFPKIREVFLAEVAKHLTVPMYALDDQSALKIIDGNVEVISEGSWKKYN